MFGINSAKGGVYVNLFASFSCFPRSRICSAHVCSSCSDLQFLITERRSNHRTRSLCIMAKGRGSNPGSLVRLPARQPLHVFRTTGFCHWSDDLEHVLGLLCCCGETPRNNYKKAGGLRVHIRDDKWFWQWVLRRSGAISPSRVTAARLFKFSNVSSFLHSYDPESPPDDFICINATA